MFTFYDEKKKKTHTLQDSFIATSISAFASCATIPVMSPNVKWSEIQTIVGMRNSSTNDPLGVVFTDADKSSFLMETVWVDHRDNDQHDGDITLFKELKPQSYVFRRMTPEWMKKEYPAWHPYHHEDKSYLK